MKTQLFKKMAFMAAAFAAAGFVVGCGGHGAAAGEHGADSTKHDSASAHGAAKHEVHWSYEGEGAPDKWSGLCEEWKNCSGKHQSPIDLTGEAFDKGLSTLAINYDKNCQLTAENNGHTVQVNMDDDNVFVLENKTYKLKQFHFHCPSEHTVAGKAFPMEIHLVHKTEAGDIAVIGLMVQEGKSNAFLDAIDDALPATAKSDTTANINFDINQILPADKSYYRYLGSLTTPPCTEGVIWTVAKQPIEATKEQIAKFAKTMPANNARPVQPLNDRQLMTSKK